MNKDQESKEKPTFKQWTPEMIEESEKKAKEAARQASENMKNGIWPESKMQNFTLKEQPIKKDQELKEKPTFKQWTPEEVKADHEKWTEAARLASEAMKNEDWPESKMQNFTLKE